MDTDSSISTRRQPRPNAPHPTHLQIPQIPTFPLSSPIVEEVLTPFLESDSPEYGKDRINNPFKSPKDRDMVDFKYQTGYISERNNSTNSLEYADSRVTIEPPVKKARPGLNVVTNFSSNNFNSASNKNIAPAPQSQTKGFLDLSDLKSLSKTKSNDSSPDKKRQPTWKTKKGGYEVLKDQADRAQTTTQQSGRVEKPSLMRRVTRKATQKYSKKLQDLSPSDRPILIGLSIPTTPKKPAIEEKAVPQKSQQTPVTPSIVVTPAIEDREWNSVWNRPPRPASSVYSQPTPYIRPSRVELIPPVPALPALSTLPGNEKYGVYPENKSSEKERDLPYADKTNGGNDSPTWFFSRGQTSPNGVNLDTPRRLSLETNSPQRGSQGWWNVLFTPLSRSNTMSSWRSYVTEDSSPPPVPRLAFGIGKADYETVLNEKEPEAGVSKFSPDTPTSMSDAKRIQSNVTAWPDMDDWYKQCQNRSTVPRPFHSPEIPRHGDCKNSPLSASSTQSIPLVISTIAPQKTEATHSMSCGHDLLSNQPCSTCLSRSNIDRFLAETSASSRGVLTKPPPQPIQNQPTEQSSNNPFFQRFVANLRHGEARRSSADSGSTTIEDDEPEMSPNIRQATATPILKAGIGTPARVHSPLPPKITGDTSKSQQNATGAKNLSSSTFGSREPRADSVPPPYSSPAPSKSYPRYRAIYPPDQQPHSPGPISPAGNNVTGIQGGIQMHNVVNIHAPPATYDHNNRLPPRPPAHPLTLFSAERPTVVRSNIELKRRRREKEEAVGRKCCGLWRGRGCFGNGGRLARGGREGRKRRRWCIVAVVIFLLLLAAGIVTAVMLTRKKDNVEIPSRWLNLTGYPAMPTGIATIGGPDPVETSSGCVHPSTMWSCSLPKEDQAMNAPYDHDSPKFRIEILFKNGTYPRSTTTIGNPKQRTTRDTLFRRILGSNILHVRGNDFTPIPAPPNLRDIEFLGNTTDGIAEPFIGEETPFFASFLSISPPANLQKRADSSSGFPNLTAIIPPPGSSPDGTAVAANLLPTPKSQPLRLFDRGKPTEHYGFYTYYDRSIFLKSVAENAALADDGAGGSTKSTARIRCTWSETRFLVQIWTQPEKAGLQLVGRPNSFNSTPSQSIPGMPDSATDFSRPGTFPYPVTIKLDRHGGNYRKKMVYCYAMNSRSQIEINEKKLQLEFRGFAGTLINPAGGIFNLSKSIGNEKKVEEWQPIDGGTGGFAIENNIFLGPSLSNRDCHNQHIGHSIDIPDLVTSMVQSNLTSLPLELRENIYYNVLYGEVPADPVLIFPETERGRFLVRSNCGGLLCTNKQINRELSDYITFCSKTGSGLSCRGDLVLVNERQYYFAWRALPWRTTHIGTCTITLSIQGVREGFSGFRTDGFSEPPVISYIHSFIRSILEYGPLLSGDNPAWITLGRLDINILTPQPPFPQGYQLLPVEGFSELRDITSGIINPRTVALEIEEYSTWELERWANSRRRAEGIFNGLRTLQVLVDGTPMYSFDIEKKFNEGQTWNRIGGQV
ncbi:hypothetical protein LOZ41_005636 [Ophidiomyces ophidiicola]|nr:hypothetical protein LOZ41_005636 [Ophidiomyces ophidiicola]